VSTVAMPRASRPLRRCAATSPSRTITSARFTPTATSRCAPWSAATWRASRSPRDRRVQKGQLMFRIQPLTYQAEFAGLRPRPRPRGGVREHQALADGNVVSETELQLARAKFEGEGRGLSLASAHLRFTDVTCSVRRPHGSAASARGQPCRGGRAAHDARPTTAQCGCTSTCPRPSTSTTLLTLSASEAGPCGC
jgi:hypothetical protein